MSELSPPTTGIQYPAIPCVIVVAIPCGPGIPRTSAILSGPFAAAHCTGNCFAPRTLAWTRSV
ncbi:hypothetical protein B0H19DRAFT_1099813 [Mycena capillaripes]|nr:hypothetical protein B0H19DRAFT_1099813 [Mycena capillaripes]